MDYLTNSQVAVFFLVLAVFTGFAVYMILFEAEFCSQDHELMVSKCESLWYWIKN